MSKKFALGVPPLVFTALIVGAFLAFLFYPLAPALIVPIFGYYIWVVREKNKELEARVAALEGHPNQPKQGS